MDDERAFFEISAAGIKQPLTICCREREMGGASQMADVRFVALLRELRMPCECLFLSHVAA
jgi:hypothetical protein